jgi:DNA-binding protein H-NS
MAKLEQIQARIKKLEAQAETLLKAKSSSAMKQIHDLMQKHNLTAADIAAYSGPGRKGRRGRVAAAGPAASSAKSAAKSKLPPKYRDPKTGATWSGHARPPAWIKSVKDRSKFLIDGVDTSSLKAEAKPASRKTAAKTSAAKKTVVKKTVAKKTAAKKAARKAVATKRVAPKSSAPARRGRPPMKKVAAKRVVGRKAATKTVEAVPTPSPTPEAATATA